jgi:hypothetical protein
MSALVCNLINKALEKGYAKRNATNALTKEYGVAYEAIKEDHRFKLSHWGTVILEFDLNSKEILKWDGFSRSDADALNDALHIFNMQGWRFFRRMGTLYLSDGAGTKYLKDMTIAENPEAEAKAKKAKINKFVKEFSTRIKDGTLADAGECWGISFGLRQCKNCEYLGSTECGGGARFVAQALEYSNTNPNLIAMVLESPNRWESTIIQAIRKFLREEMD